ncbi:MAG: 16S rRNA (uracil(1498)-N(3))-methyltransferase [Vicinamibacterales bacterium]
MPPRFHAPDMDPTPGTVRLPESEGRHLARVLRLAPGARVRVFDGRGAEWEAEVAAIAAGLVDVRLVAPVAPAREAAVPVTLGLAVLKGDKMDDVVRDAVMLGAAAIRPFVATRTEIGLAALGRAGRAERWRRVAVASAKQCGRAVVPDVGDPVTFAALLDGAGPGTARYVLVEPSAGTGATPAGTLPRPEAALVLVGPEGGWTPAEIAAATAAGFTPVTLGPWTLRADAVPLVALTALAVAWGEA